MIDPSIPLGVRPATFNLGDMFGAMQGMQQMRAQGQQSRINALHLQQAEDAQADTEAINAALRTSLTPDGAPDYNLAARTLEIGGHGQAGQKIRTFMAAQAKAQAEAAELALKNEATRYGNMDTRLGLAHGLLSGAKRNPESYPAVRGKIVELLGPELGGKLPQTIGDGKEVDAALAWGENTRAGLATRKGILDEVAAKGLAQKHTEESFDFWTDKAGRWLQTTGNDVQDRVKALETLKSWNVPAGVVEQFGDPTAPDFQKRVATVLISPEKRAELAGQAEGRAETAAYHRSEIALRGQTNAREQAKFNATYGAGVAEDGKPLPANPTAKAIAEYRIPPPSARSMASGPGKALMDQVLALNPEYRGEEFPTRQKMRAAFTSGPQGQTLNSLNTAIEHLDQFVDAAKALGNGNFKPGNTAWNAVREAFGDTAPTNFDGIKTIMAGELASAFKKSGATDAEIKDVKESISKSSSTAQLVEYATKIAIPALGSKANAFRDQYRSVMGKTDPWSALSDSSRGVLSKHGYDPEHPTMGGAKADATGLVQLLDPAGVPRMVPADKVSEYLRRGGRRP